MNSHAHSGPCAEAVANLYALLDRELTDDVRQRVQKHFDDCPDCFPLYRFERSFSLFLRARSGALAAPSDLKRQVFESLLLENDTAGGR